MSSPPNWARPLTLVIIGNSIGLNEHDVQETTLDISSIIMCMCVRMRLYRRLCLTQGMRWTCG